MGDSERNTCHINPSHKYCTSLIRKLDNAQNTLCDKNAPPSQVDHDTQRGCLYCLREGWLSLGNFKLYEEIVVVSSITN